GRENVEALAVEPESGDIYYATRGDTDGVALYHARPDGTASRVVSRWHFGTTHGGALATAADFDVLGRRFLFRTYMGAYLWERAAGEPWDAALSRAPCVIALERERQGEAIAFSADGRSFYTLSEGVGEPIRRYPFSDPLK